MIGVHHSTRVRNHEPSRYCIARSFLVVALSGSGALFLLLELDRPFNGLIRISGAPMQNVLSHFGR